MIFEFRAEMTSWSRSKETMRTRKMMTMMTGGAHKVNAIGPDRRFISVDPTTGVEDPIFIVIGSGSA